MWSVQAQPRHGLKSLFPHPHPASKWRPWPPLLMRIDPIMSIANYATTDTAAITPTHSNWSTPESTSILLSSTPSGPNYMFVEAMMAFGCWGSFIRSLLDVLQGVGKWFWHRGHQRHSGSAVRPLVSELPGYSVADRYFSGDHLLTEAPIGRSGEPGASEKQ